MFELYRMMTVAFFAVHLMVGCCAHHAHACNGSSHSDNDGACLEISGRHAGDHDSHSEHGDPCAHHCQQARCSAILPHSGLGGLSGPQAQAICVASDELHVGPRPCLGQRSVAWARFSPTVRLHLANQVLLI
jgi:hypothetical protein